MLKLAIKRLNVKSELYLCTLNLQPGDAYSVSRLERSPSEAENDWDEAEEDVDS